jgi:predicted glycosyltransferase
MKVLIHLGHPAQFHFFKNIITQLLADGHQVKILLGTKDILEQLVQESGFPYLNIQKKRRKNTDFAMAWAAVKRILKVLLISCKYRPQLFLGGDPSVMLTAFLFHKFGLAFSDDDMDIVIKSAQIAIPFADCILAHTECRMWKYQSKKIAYAGCMKLAYLHPNHFTPCCDIAGKYVSKKKYILLRIASLTAYHDKDIQGLELEIVLHLIKIAESFNYQVYISSEIDLDKRLKAYQLKIHYSDIHHVMNYASLLISDSQSMSVEAAMLGVPSIRFSDFVGRISLLEELETVYGLTYGIKTSDVQGLYARTEELLALPNLREIYQGARNKLLNDKIDVTAFMVWFIENFPESKRIMRNNPDYQYRFK